MCGRVGIHVRHGVVEYAVCNSYMRRIPTVWWVLCPNERTLHILHKMLINSHAT